jgi:hypothetical protein
MMKFLLQPFYLLLVAAALVVAPGAGAEARPAATGSFKSGFSQQRAAPAPSKPAGSFGSFGSAHKAPDTAPAGQKSDSALSRRLDKQAPESNALRTLDERRAAQQPARDIRPVPAYEDRAAPAPAPMPAPQPAPIIVQQGSSSGIGQVMTGYVLGRMASGASHNNANNGGVASTANTANTASIGQPPQRSFFGGVLQLFMWLMLWSALAWLAWFSVKRWRAKRAASQPNYSFERQ